MRQRYKIRSHRMDHSQRILMRYYRVHSFFWIDFHFSPPPSSNCGAICKSHFKLSVLQSPTLTSSPTIHTIIANPVDHPTPSFPTFPTSPFCTTSNDRRLTPDYYTTTLIARIPPQRNPLPIHPIRFLTQLCGNFYYQ